MIVVSAVAVALLGLRFAAQLAAEQELHAEAAASARPPFQCHRLLGPVSSPFGIGACSGCGNKSSAAHWQLELVKSSAARLLTAERLTGRRQALRKLWACSGFACLLTCGCHACAAGVVLPLA
ncbi:hypothetical protein Efla_006984 [Eimeria flavescens]